MIFGGTEHEHIQFNELSLWTGDETNTGAYQDFGDLYIDFEGKDTTPHFASPLPQGSWISAKPSRMLILPGTEWIIIANFFAVFLIG